MKILMVNGSANQRGCTYTALSEIGAAAQELGAEWEIFQLGGQPMRDCIGCGQCRGKGKCVFADGGVLRQLGQQISFCRKTWRGGGVRPAGRDHRLPGRGEQVLRHYLHACGVRYLLEHGPRPHAGGGETGPGGPSDHAKHRPEHGLDD